MERIPPAAINIIVAWSDLGGKDHEHLTTWIGEMERALIKIEGNMCCNPLILEAYLYNEEEGNNASGGYYNVLAGIDYLRLDEFRDLYVPLGVFGQRDREGARTPIGIDRKVVDLLVSNLRMQPISNEMPSLEMNLATYEELKRIYPKVDERMKVIVKKRT